MQLGAQTKHNWNLKTYFYAFLINNEFVLFNFCDYNIYWLAGSVSIIPDVAEMWSSTNTNANLNACLLHTCLWAWFLHISELWETWFRSLCLCLSRFQIEIIRLLLVQTKASTKSRIVTVHLCHYVAFTHPFESMKIHRSILESSRMISF